MKAGDWVQVGKGKVAHIVWNGEGRTIRVECSSFGATPIPDSLCHPAPPGLPVCRIARKLWRVRNGKV